MSNLLSYAEEELNLAGYNDGDGMNSMMKRDVLKLINEFGKQGHSGFSAPFAIRLFEKLSMYEPLTPLTGAFNEWNPVHYDKEGFTFQNNRCSHVFWSEEGVYDIYGYVFEEDNGCRYTSRLSRKFITFPYMPEKPRNIKTSSMEYWFMENRNRFKNMPA